MKEVITAPPSQGKVERAREMLADAFALKAAEGKDDPLTTQALNRRAAWLRDGKNPSPFEKANIAAITQALTESSERATWERCSYCSKGLMAFHERENGGKVPCDAWTSTEPSGQGTDGAMPAWPDLSFEERRDITILLQQTAGARTRYENVRGYLRTNVKSNQPDTGAGK